MKTITRLSIFFLLIPFLGISQSEVLTLNFDKKYYQAVDKWVAFPKSEKDSLYSFGFIYIDQMAGFSFRFENTFKIDGQKLIASDGKPETTLMTYRLEPNTKLVAELTEDQMKQLNLPKTPEWLKIYKSDESSLEYLKDIGYHYNHVGASKEALEPLLKAYKIDPDYSGLAFELAFAYNATGQYEKAVTVLDSAIKKNKDQLLYKELGFAFMNLNKFDEAEKIYSEGIESAKDNSIKAEMAINMCAIFFNQKNKPKYDKWLATAKKYMGDNSPFQQYVNYFEAEWKKVD